MDMEALKKIRNENLAFFKAVASYLNNFPTLVTKEIMDEICGGVAENEQISFATFLSVALTDNDEEGLMFEREYLKKSVKRLDPKRYQEDPYFKGIKIPTKQIGSWALGYQTYAPYEGFIYDDIDVMPNYREIPKIGFFSEEFSFPTVYENGVEWMAIKPNEIETMRPHIEKMSGDVVVFGLGLGYFAYMASQKPNVNSVTIVERDSSVIKLFENYILPQFENKQKIKIIKMDAFDFAKNEMKNSSFDHAFVDLWHDASDGVELYAKMKKHEIYSPKTKFSYWIEKTLLSCIRWNVFEGILKQIQNGKYNEPYEKTRDYLSDNSLRNLVKII